MSAFKKNANIKLHTTIRDGVDIEKTSVEVLGVMAVLGRTWRIAFTEKNEADEVIHTTVIIKTDHVLVKRTGAVSFEQKFIEGQTTLSEYRHPLLTFRVLTCLVKIDKKIDVALLTLSLAIDYETIINEENKRHHTLKLQVEGVREE